MLRKEFGPIDVDSLSRKAARLSRAGISSSVQSGSDQTTRPSWFAGVTVNPRKSIARRYLQGGAASRR